MVVLFHIIFRKGLENYCLLPENEINYCDLSKDKVDSLTSLIVETDHFFQRGINHAKRI